MNEHGEPEKMMRSLQLTDAGLRAIGVQPSREVPLLDVPWRDDAKDRRDGGAA